MIQLTVRRHEAFHTSLGLQHNHESVWKLYWSERQLYSAGPETVGEMTIESSTAESIVDLFRAAQVPLTVPPVHGLDGEMWTLTVDSGLHHASIAWWGSPPAEWRVVTEAVRVLISLVPRDIGLRLLGKTSNSP